MLLKLPPLDTGWLYPEMASIVSSNDFLFDLDKEIKFSTLQDSIPEFKFIKIVDIFLNYTAIYENCSQIDGAAYEGPLNHHVFTEEFNKNYKNVKEWVYCLMYDRRIVKIGMTASGMKCRMRSYRSGDKKSMRKGTCSTTNYVISECNYLAWQKKLPVEIYAYPITSHEVTINIFGDINTVIAKTSTEYETALINRVIELNGKKPILCGLG